MANKRGIRCAKCGRIVEKVCANCWKCDNCCDCKEEGKRWINRFIGGH